MDVATLMTSDPATCGPAHDLRVAARQMWDHSYGCLPVVDGDGQVVGMLTDRDICLAAYIQEADLAQLRVDSAMTRDVVTCRPDQTLLSAQRLMRKHRVRRLPVVDRQGTLVGLLSLDDLARAALSRRYAGQKGLSSADITSTFAAVSLRRNQLAPAADSKRPSRRQQVTVRKAAAARRATAAERPAPGARRATAAERPTTTGARRSPRRTRSR